MKISAFPPRLVISLLVILIAAGGAQVFAQGNLPSSPPVPVVTNDGSANADIDTPMTVEQPDPVLSATEPPTNDSTTPDPNYTPPPEPYAPDQPDTSSSYEGPVGVTGIFNGNVNTACSYDPLSHSAHRAIDDIVVPGSIGKYPLKMTRYYNSRQQYYAGNFIGLSPGWAHEYSWLLWSAGHKVVSPHGNVYDDFCGAPVGVSEGWENRTDTYDGTWRLADGGKVGFSGGLVRYIEDPYGLRTNMTYNGSNQLTKVTEPGGRYLQFTYGPATDQDGTVLLTRVDAHGLGDANVTDSVYYTYQEYDPITPSVQARRKQMLRRVDYSDGTYALYDYRTDNVTENQTTHKMYPALQRCDDVRYNGPMRTVVYEYQSGGPHGVIVDEKCPGIGAVSAIAPGVPVSGDTTDGFTEMRGDGPTRTFNYTHIHHCQGTCGPCEDYGTNGPNQQMLQSYTDFHGHTTQLGYDLTTWYITSATDANLNITRYQRGLPPPSGIGEITKITYPGGAYVQYVYQPESGIGGHYIQTFTDENQNMTTYHRDGTNHQIYEIDYPDSPDSETFTRNPFGQVLNHHLRNGAWERFAYDTRGLLTDKWNPENTLPADSDPHTHYTYYTAADVKPGWIDRVKTITLPANWYGYQAMDTFEYDKDAQNQPCAGRGLVTKIRHWIANGDKIQTFAYNQFGNKAWETDELTHQTSYAHDSYNRVTTVTDPLTHIDTLSYLKPGSNSSYLHTTGSIYTHTSPAGIVTTNTYDENFRKSSTTVGSSMTSFAYDPVGNLQWVTDPRNYQTYNTYDPRNRKTSATEAYGIPNLARTTTWHYDGASNIYQIDRPDTTQETKSYDAMNRVLTDTVPKDNSTSITTTFNYNPSGTINWVKDGNNHTTSFAYNPSDEKILMTYYDNSYQSWVYDPAHNLQKHITVAGHTQYSAYDERNRKFADYWDANANVPEWRYFVHDAAGRLIGAENGTSVWGQNVISYITRTYDAAGRLTSDQQNPTGLPGGARSMNYPTYDADGRLTRMYASSGSYDYTFGYDAMGRFQTISPTNGSVAFQYHYDAASNEIERDNLLTLVNQLYPRDALNRMLSMAVTKSGTTLEQEGYTFDAMNRLTVVNWENSHSDSFNYYQDGELNQAQYGNFNRTVNFNLDKAGNRTSVVDNNTTTSYTPNTINQYTGVQGSAISNGNGHEISGFNSVTYIYINDGRLSSASSGANTYTLAYDALGRCVTRTLNGNTTYYLYDGEKPVVEFDSTGAVSAQNLYGKGVDEILIRTVPANNWTLYYQQNHEGSVTLVTNAGGGVIERYRYDAFGAPTFYDTNWNQINYSTFNNRFLFTGREYAAATSVGYNAGFKFYEYRARAYNPGLGRFMSEDPKLFGAGDYNLFRYCHNDPEDLTDPMGTEQDWAQTGAPVSGNHVAIEMAAEDRAYNYTMAALQRSPQASLEGGTIATGMVGQALMQQARREAQKISEGTENRSGRQSAMPQKGQPLGPGLAPTTNEQIAYGVAGAERMGELTQGSMEANVAVGYNMDTGRYGYSGYVMSRPVPGGQQALTPALPPGHWAYAAQAHGHHARIGFTGNDFYWANIRALPIFIHNARGVSMYVPPTIPVQSMAPLGMVFGPGGF